MLIDFICLFLSTIMLINSFRKLKIEFNGRVYFYWFFWVVFVLPLWLDYLIGKPDYSSWGHRMYGFSISYDDDITRIIYAIFLLFMQIILLYHRPKLFLKRRGCNESIDNRSLNKNSLLSKKIIFICFIMSMISPMMCILSGFPRVLITIGWREKYLFQEFSKRGVSTYVEKFAYIGVIACIIIIGFKISMDKWNNFFLKLLAIVLLIMNINAESKRSIILFLIVVSVYIYFLKHRDENVFKVVIYILISMVAVVAISIFVKTYYRGYSGFSAIYTTLRIDFFRDDTVKLAIYSILYPDKIKILSFPFESYLMQFGYFFVISLLVGKGIVAIPRIGYNQYLTAALIDSPISEAKFMTTSMFDEAIANFGLCGIVIIAVLLSYFLSFADELTDFETVLWISFGILYSMYSLDYILVYLEVIIFIYIYMRFNLKNNRL